MGKSHGTRDRLPMRSMMNHVKTVTNIDDTLILFQNIAFESLGYLLVFGEGRFYGCQ